VNEDPIGFEAGDSNLRRYVHNDPMANSDPSGLDERGGDVTQPKTPDKLLFEAFRLGVPAPWRCENREQWRQAANELEAKLRNRHVSGCSDIPNVDGLHNIFGVARNVAQDFFDQLEAHQRRELDVKTPMIGSPPPEARASFDKQMKWAQYFDLAEKVRNGDVMMPDERARFEHLNLRYRFEQRSQRYARMDAPWYVVAADVFFSPANDGLGNMNDILMPVAGMVGGNVLRGNSEPRSEPPKVETAWGHPLDPIDPGHVRYEPNGPTFPRDYLPPSATPKSVADDLAVARARVQGRTAEIRQQLGRAHDFGETYAVGAVRARDGTIKYYVASKSPYGVAKVNSALQAGEELVGDGIKSDLHAEMLVQLIAESRGETLLGVGATRPMCKTYRGVPWCQNYFDTIEVPVWTSRK
jgi:hypothetical protein